jgi:Porin subfamily
MKLKSLLLGSAAALVAFSGARAADAVIAEPEPVEYVRVCDAYGAGYFYIPGTETCLKIGGFIRYQIDVTDTSDTWAKETKANISFSAKSDTELGTLEGFVELTDVAGDVFPNVSTTSGTVTIPNGMGIDSAYISLGGLKMGYYDNAFDGGIGGENDGLGGSKGNTIGYTFASGGFDATINLDHAGIDETNFVPNISANAGFSAGAVAVRGFIAYDEEAGETAAKLRVGADVTEGGRLEAAVVYATGATYSWSAAEWSVAASYSQKVSDKVSVSVGAQYWSDVAFVSGVDQWKIGANVDWTPVTNFLVRAQVEYIDNSAAGDAIGARLRFQRSF